MCDLNYTQQRPRAKEPPPRPAPPRALSGRATVGPGGTLEGRGQYAGASHRYHRVRGGKLGRSLARAIRCREVGPRYVPYSRKSGPELHLWPSYTQRFCRVSNLQRRAGKQLCCSHRLNRAQLGNSPLSSN